MHNKHVCVLTAAVCCHVHTYSGRGVFVDLAGGGRADGILKESNLKFNGVL